MKTKQAIEDIRVFLDVLGKDFITEVEKAHYTDDESIDWLRRAFVIAANLVRHDSFDQALKDWRLTKKQAKEEILLLHRHIGYAYTLLLQAGKLEALADFEPFQWPYPYSALGVLVAQPDNLSPKHERGKFVTLQGFCTFAWLGGMESQDQVSRFVAKMCDSEKAPELVLSIALG